MKLINFVKSVFAATLMVGAMSAQADAVSCGNATLGIRVATVDPALVGGYCYAQNGNLQNADITGLGLTLIEKDVAPNDFIGSDTTGTLNYSRGGKEYGTWSFASSLWNTWSQLFLGFHFGGGGDTSLRNPDSFIVELKSPDAAGTWALEGTDAKLNGLSNIYLIGKGGSNQVPEPGSLVLLALGLLAAGAASRARHA